MGKSAKKKEKKKNSALASIRSKTIILVRHGEKPPKAQETGQLSSLGEQRSLHLQLIGRRWKPQSIFATQPRPGDDRPRAARMLQTMQPLAEELKLSIDTTHHVDEIKALVNSVKSSDKDRVLVCWAHEYLPKIARAFLKDKPNNLVWDRAEYDQVWIVSRGKLRVEKQEFEPEIITVTN